MTAEDPRVSIIMPCFNADPLQMREALNSVRSQSFPSVEVIVVDDGSTNPDTLGFLKLIQGEGITVLHTENGGPAAARNHGIQVGRGEFIYPLDADDIIGPDFLEAAVAAMDRDPALDIVYGDVELFGDGVLLLEMSDHATLEQMLLGSQIMNGSLFRRIRWETLGGYDEALVVGYEDYEWWVRILAAGGTARRVATLAYRWRQQDGSRSREHLRSARAVERATRARIAANNANESERLLAACLSLIAELSEDRVRLRDDVRILRERFGPLNRLLDNTPWLARALERARELKRHANTGDDQKINGGVGSMIQAAQRGKHRAFLAGKDARTILSAIRWRLEKSRVRTAKKVGRGMALPDLPRRTRRPGSVWAISVVKNEADIIERTITHLVEQGVDSILVADNGSTDGTLSILRTLEDRLGIYVAVDHEPGHFHGQKMDALARAAARAGADWIVPFDADELWFAADDTTLADALRSCHASIARAEMHNAFPIEGSSSGPEWCIDRVSAPLEKVAFKWHPLAQLHHGNHAVTRPGRSSSPLRIVHLPWRSLSQFESKVRIGAAAMDTAYGMRVVAGGDHWRDLRDLDRAALHEAWDDLVSGRANPLMLWTPSSDLTPCVLDGSTRWKDVISHA